MRTAGLMCLLAAAALTASADSIYSFSAASTASDSNDLSLGFVFATNQDVTISSLGYYDGGNGFLATHKVGIFDSNGNLLTSITLDTGTMDTSDGLFRYKSVAPITLAGGQTYTLAGTTDGDADSFAFGTATTLTGFTVNPAISIADDASRFIYQSDNTLQNPTNHFDYTLYAGPNFEIATSDSNNCDAPAVPEPSSASLLLAAGAIVPMWIGYKRRQRGRTFAANLIQ